MRGGIWIDEDGRRRSNFGFKRYDKNRHSLRHMKTTQEIRENVYFLSMRRSDGVAVAGRVRRLPTVYDDFVRDLDDRSWKRYRRTQRRQERQRGPESAR